MGTVPKQPELAWSKIINMLRCVDIAKCYCGDIYERFSLCVDGLAGLEPY
jgi:hypothetical protein